MNGRNTRVLVVIYRLTEGFDYKEVSVVAILRNVNKKSRVYFAQFVGRAVRKLHKDDPVIATVISSTHYRQRIHFDAFKNNVLPPDIREDQTRKTLNLSDLTKIANTLLMNVSIYSYYTCNLVLCMLIFVTVMYMDIFGSITQCCFTQHGISLVPFTHSFLSWLHTFAEKSPVCPRSIFKTRCIWGAICLKSTPFLTFINVGLHL